MTVKTILRVKRNEREFYVLAEPFWAKHKHTHINTKTKSLMDPSEVSYKLVRLKDGKPHKTIGFVSNIQPGTQQLNVKISDMSTPIKLIEYNSQILYILEKVYCY